jgi:purine-binding chemotaxis protein CheW
MAIDTSAKPVTSNSSSQFSTFYVADLFFGVDVLHVQEVLRAQPMTSVPQAPNVIEGLINLRGQIVTAIDMRRRLLLPARGADHPGSMNIVVRTADGAVSLLVDEIGDVVEVTDESFERPPETLHGKVREVILGIHKLDKQLMHVLNTDKACETAETLTTGA